MKSIRWRIGLSVFLLVAALQVALSGWVLDRVWSAELDQIDDDLAEELLELARLEDAAEFVAFVRSETQDNTKWDEDFFEIRDADGRLLAASANVPAAGLGPALGSDELRPRRRSASAGAMRIWERTHPRSGKGHVRLRVAEMRADGRRLVTAESLKASQKAYWQLRQQLLWSLAGVALVGAAGAWWVTRRALAPIQALTERARELGASPSGSLPRSGRGDELDRLAAVLNGMLERIRAEIQRVKRLSEDAAHALRTPLAAIRGTLEVHLRTRSAEEARDLLPALEVLDETGRLLNRLLLLARLESAGTAPDRLREVRLDAVVAEVEDALSLVAQDRKLELECSARPVRVLGNPDQLREALLNLLDNALRHTPPGGRVEVAVYASGDTAHLVVEDTGPGLRPDQLERVFERFYSEREGGPGSGLGLAIARAIACAHGGSLSVSSPRGARFELRLPLAPPAAAARRGSER